MTKLGARHQKTRTIHFDEWLKISEAITAANDKAGENRDRAMQILDAVERAQQTMAETATKSGSDRLDRRQTLKTLKGNRQLAHTGIRVAIS